MIDPVNLFKIDVINKNGAVFNVNELPPNDTEEYDLEDDKDFKKFVSDVEKEVRDSFEYRELVKYYKQNKEMNQGLDFENIISENGNKIKIEIHHSPFTLYDICIIVINKRMFYKESLDLEMVAKEAAQLHYKSMVGLIPLTQTEHQLVHNGYLFVPTTNVDGRYNLFIDYYKEFMSPEQLDVIDRIEEYTKMYLWEQDNKNILQQSNIYINPSGAYNLPKFEDLAAALSSRVQEIKDNAYTLPTLEDSKYINDRKGKYECVEFTDNWKYEAISFI